MTSAAGTRRRTTASRRRRSSGRRRCWSGCRSAATRRCSTRAAARAASPSSCSTGCRAATWWPWTRRESMVEHAREALDPERTTVLQADLTELELDEPVDAAFSNAVFHWIPDHDALFARLHAALRPGGPLVAQCGGEGNVARFHAAAREVAAERALRRAPRRLDRPVELRRRRGDRRAARASRLRGDRHLARALSDHPGGPDRLPDARSASARTSEQLPEELRAGYVGGRAASAPDPSWTTCGSISTRKSPARAQETVQYRTFVRRARLSVDLSLTRGDIAPMAGVPVRVLIADDQQLAAAGTTAALDSGGRIRAGGRGRERARGPPSLPRPSIRTWRS